MATNARSAHPAPRTRSKLERSNARRRSSATFIALIGAMGVFLFAGSITLFVFVLTPSHVTAQRPMQQNQP